MKTRITLCFILLSFNFNYLLAQDEWFWQNPLPQGNDIYDICRDVSTETYFACGDYGTILRKKNLSNWQIIKQDEFENLYSIYFKGDYGWAVGYNGTILQNIDGTGATWYPLNSGTDKMLLSVFFFDQMNGWIVGQDQTVLYTADGGTNWNNVVPTGTNHYFSVYFTSLLNGWIAGAAGTNGIILKTTDGGNTWITSLIPSNRMNSIKFINENTGCVVGDEGEIFVTSDAGANWNLSVSNTTSHLRDFIMNSSGEGWAVGYNGTILFTDDFGESWSVQTSGTDNILYAVEGSRIVGQAGDILHTSNLGATWDFESSGFTDWLYGIDFADEDNGWVVGVKGKIFHTSDGGNTWEKEDSVTNKDLLAVDFFNPYSGYAVGKLGTVLKYRSGPYGTGWFDKSISTTNHLNAVFRLGISKLAWIAGEFGTIWKTEDYGDTWQIQHQNSGYHLYAIHFVSRYYGWAAGMSGTVLKTTDGGENWVDISPDNLSFFNSIYFTDHNHGWVVGVGGIIYRTIDGGANWIEPITKPTYERLNSVYFVDENRGWIAGANGTILYSDNGGETWFYQNSGSISELRSLSFTESGVGWIAGFNGVILKTEDGGGELTVSQYRRFALNIEIPDLGIASDIIDVEASPKLLKMLDNNLVSGITVMLDSVIHPHISDLTLLLSHEGITDTLFYQAGEEGADIILCNMSDASTMLVNEGEAPFTGNFKPHSPLSVFNGINPIGEWTLTIHDGLSGNIGTLKAWGLKLYFDKATDIKNETPKIPTEFVLHQNYPNPFNPTTTIKYTIPNKTHPSIPSREGKERSDRLARHLLGGGVLVTLKVYDILGREVATLVNQKQKPGYYEVNWSATGGVYNLSSGVYFYKLSVGNKFSKTKKLVLLK